MCGEFKQGGSMETLVMEIGENIVGLILGLGAAIGAALIAAAMFRRRKTITEREILDDIEFPA
jgi:hypothetical protein